jgi:hypothetical protein
MVRQVKIDFGACKEFKGFKIVNKQAFDHFFSARKGKALKCRKTSKDPAIGCLVSQQVNMGRNANEVSTLKGPIKGERLYCTTLWII